jgi:hypothetical protein
MNSPPPIRPVAGHRFRAVAQLPVKGAKRRKLLALLAAFADAGVYDPPVSELAERLHLEPVVIAGLAIALAEAGFLVEDGGRRPPDRLPYRLLESSPAKGAGR